MKGESLETRLVYITRNPNPSPCFGLIITFTSSFGRWGSLVRHLLCRSVGLMGNVPRVLAFVACSMVALVTVRRRASLSSLCLVRRLMAWVQLASSPASSGCLVAFAVSPGYVALFDATCSWKSILFCSSCSFRSGPRGRPFEVGGRCVSVGFIVVGGDWLGADEAAMAAGRAEAMR